MFWRNSPQARGRGRKTDKRVTGRAEGSRRAVDHLALALGELRRRDESRTLGMKRFMPATTLRGRFSRPGQKMRLFRLIITKYLQVFWVRVGVRREMTQVRNVALWGLN